MVGDAADHPLVARCAHRGGASGQNVGAERQLPRSAFRICCCLRLRICCCLRLRPRDRIADLGEHLRGVGHQRLVHPDDLPPLVAQVLQLFEVLLRLRLPVMVGAVVVEADLQRPAAQVEEGALRPGTAADDLPVPHTHLGLPAVSGRQQIPDEQAQQSLPRRLRPADGQRQQPSHPPDGDHSPAGADDLRPGHVSALREGVDELDRPDLLRWESRDGGDMPHMLGGQDRPQTLRQRHRRGDYPQLREPRVRGDGVADRIESGGQVPEGRPQWSGRRPVRPVATTGPGGAEQEDHRGVRPVRQPVVGGGRPAAEDARRVVEVLCAGPGDNAGGVGAGVLPGARHLPRHDHPVGDGCVVVVDLPPAHAPGEQAPAGHRNMVREDPHAVPGPAARRVAPLLRSLGDVLRQPPGRIHVLVTGPVAVGHGHPPLPGVPLTPVCRPHHSTAAARVAGIRRFPPAPVSSPRRGDGRGRR
jgi:hypothetical protein